MKKANKPLGCQYQFILLLLCLILGYFFKEWIGSILFLLIGSSILFPYFIWNTINTIRDMRLAIDKTGRTPSNCRCCSNRTSIGKEYSFYYGTENSKKTGYLTVTNSTLYGQQSYFICDICVYISLKKSLIKQMSFMYVNLAICLTSILIMYGQNSTKNETLKVVAALSGCLILFAIAIQGHWLDFEYRAIDMAISAWKKENSNSDLVAFRTWKGKQPS